MWVSADSVFFIKLYMHNDICIHATAAEPYLCWLDPYIHYTVSAFGESVS